MIQERLKLLREERGFSQQSLATKLELSRQSYNNYETGKRTPDLETIKKMANFFNVSVDYLTGNSSGVLRRGVKIPVLGRVQAGIPIEAIEDILDYEEITPELAKTGDFFALQIRGDSMEPRIAEGDVVIVKKQPDVDSGDLAIVLVEAREATVKKLLKYDAGLSLVPFNNMYEPMFYTNKEVLELPVTVLGKVIELRAKF